MLVEVLLKKILISGAEEKGKWEKEKGKCEGRWGRGGWKNEV